MRHCCSLTVLHSCSWTVLQTWDEEVEKSLGEIKKIRFYLLVDSGALLLIDCGTFLLLNGGAFLFLDRVVLGVAHLGTEEVSRDQVAGGRKNTCSLTVLHSCSFTVS